MFVGPLPFFLLPEKKQIGLSESCGRASAAWADPGVGKDV